MDIKKLAQGCVEEAENPFKSEAESELIAMEQSGFWGEPATSKCDEFFKEFIKTQKDIKSDDEGRIWNEHYNEFTIPSKLDGALRSKLMRKALKELFPDISFSVRLDRYSMGNSIDIRWKDGPAKRTVEQTKLKDVFADVFRDPYTGEILSGGNSFIFNNRDYSDEARKWAEDYIKEKFGVDDKAIKYDNTFSSEIWELLGRTDFRTKPPTILKNANE